MMKKEKKAYRLRYQYELMCLLLKTNKRNVRQRMRRQGMSNSVEDMARYLVNGFVKKVTNGLDERDFVKNEKISGGLDKGSDVENEVKMQACKLQENEEDNKDNGGRLNKGDGVKSALLNEGWEQEDNKDNEVSYVGEDQMDEW